MQEKKGLLFFIFFVVCLSNAPLYPMFPGMRRSTQQVPFRLATKRPLQTTQSPTSAQPTLSWHTRLANATAQMRAAFARYWYGSNSSSAKAQNLINMIQNSLGSPNGVDECDQIKNFLKNETIENSENVFKALMQTPYPACVLSLQNTIKNDTTFAKKAMLLIEKFLKSNEKIKIENVAYILVLIPNNVDPLKLEQLKQRFWNSIEELNWIAQWLENNNLSELLPTDPKEFATAIANFCKAADRSKSRSLFGPSSINSPQKKFAQAIIQKNLSSADLAKLCLRIEENENGYADYILNELDPLLTDSELLSLQNAMKSIAQDTLLSLCDFNSPTPSCLHLRKYHNSIPIEFTPATKKNFFNMLKNVIAEEEKAMNDYEVVYHGRRWTYGFYSYIYGLIYSHKTGIKLEDYIFPHLNEPAVGTVSEKFIASEQQKREYLKQHGNPFPGLTKSNEKTPVAMESFLNRQRLLFVNKFLFGNLERLGSNSINYILGNYNQSKNIAFSSEEIFNMFGYSNAYKKYEEKLDALQKEYNSLSDYGELLQILIPKNIVGECLYKTNSGGPKKGYVFYEHSSDGIIQHITSNIQTILKQENQDPHDIGEYALIMSHDLALNPKSGIKVYSYNAADPEKWAAFQEKLKKFALELEQGLAEADEQKQQSQMVKE